MIPYLQDPDVTLYHGDVPSFPVDENGWAQMNIRLRPELRAEVDAFCEEMGWPRHVFLITALYIFRQLRTEALDA